MISPQRTTIKMAICPKCGAYTHTMIGVKNLGSGPSVANEGVEADQMAEMEKSISIIDAILASKAIHYRPNVKKVDLMPKLPTSWYGIKLKNYSLILICWWSKQRGGLILVKARSR